MRHFVRKTTGKGIRIKWPIVMLVTLFLSTSIHSQVFKDSWVQIYGGSSWDVCNDMVPTRDGNFIAAGYTYSFGAGSADFYVLKFDALGNALWTKEYGGSGTDAAYAIQACTDGYIITGKTRSYGAGRYDVYLVKTDLTGGTVFTKTFGGWLDDEGRDVIQTHDGGFAIAGINKSSAVGEQDMYLVKTKSDGQLEWEKTYGGYFRDEAHAVLQTGDDGYLITGYTSPSGDGTGDVCVVRTNANGEELWTKTFGGPNDDWGFDLLQTVDGNFLIAGITSSFGEGNYDFYAIKITAEGNMLWSQTYGGPNVDYCQSAIQTMDGGYMLAGYTASFGSGGHDQYFVKIDKDGVVEGESVVGESEDDYAYAVTQVAEFEYISAGYTYSYGAASCDACFIGLSPSNRPPVADAGSNSLYEGTSYDGAEAVLDASGSTDPDEDPLTFTWFENGSVLLGPVSASISAVTLPLGEHEIILLVEDGMGASDADTVLVTIQDTTSPDIQLVLDPNILWPPNSKMADITASVQVSDICDPDVSFVLTSVTSSEPDDAKGKDDGETVNDIQDADLNTPDTAFSLRAERNGKGDGRQYVVVYTTTDHSGNTAVLSDTVWVPKSMDKKKRSEPRMADGMVPLEYALGNNHPNPFNPETTISFQLPETQHVTLTIYNIFGRAVRTVTDRTYQAGVHSVIWDSRDDSGSPVSSGMYIYTIRAGSFTAVRKMSLLR